MTPPTNQHYSFPLVAKAAQTPYETVKRWALRGQLVMRDTDRETMGRGGQRQVSYHTAAQAIIMAALVRQGVKIVDASEAGAKFGHAGSLDRPPGHLFEGASTIIGYNAESPIKSHILRVSKRDSFWGVFQKVSPNAETLGGVFVDAQILLLNAAPVLGMDDAWIRDTLE